LKVTGSKKGKWEKGNYGTGFQQKRGGPGGAKGRKNNGTTISPKGERGGSGLKKKKAVSGGGQEMAHMPRSPWMAELWKQHQKVLVSSNCNMSV